MMILYSESMYPDDVLYSRHVPVVKPSGASTATFPTPAVPMRASVQPANVDQADASGRTYTTLVYSIYTPTTPAAVADDKIEYTDRAGIFHVLAVEGPTTQRGIGGVTWLTQCVETK
jgi:hypothetical protein